MAWFGKKKMSESEVEIDDFFEEKQEIPVNDKRRFNTDGERVASDTAESPKTDNMPPIVRQLEDEIKIERERREAAELKLVGVQAKFDELRASMEKETSEMRQRMQRHNETRMQTEKAEFLSALLPILDNMNLAISAGETDSSIENLLVGVKGTVRLFEQSLMSHGVEPINSIGANFDPELHEAVEMVAANEEDDGKVVGEFSRGYKFGERLLRPARVQVGRK